MGKPHQCEGCHRTFARADALRRHREKGSKIKCVELVKIIKEKKAVIAQNGVMLT